MTFQNSKARAVALTLAGLLASASPAAAQYYPGYPPGGYYPPAGPAFGPGGAGYGAGQYLQGSASVINASGNLSIQQEQARLDREKAEQAKLVTRKQAFDELAYEKANTPTFTETEEKNQAMSIRRVLNNPPVSEIYSGKALNTMMPLMRTLADVGTSGHPVLLDQDLVKHINLTVPDGSNPGMLRGKGALEWPLALRGEQQESIDSLYRQAVTQASQNKLTPALFSQLKKEAGQLNKIVLSKLAADELDGTSYLASKRFIAGLEQALDVLQQPTAARYLNGTYTAKGGTVQELVQNMTKQGLEFAPANPGDENYYVGLQRAMVSYANAASDYAPIRIRLANQQAIEEPKKK